MEEDEICLECKRPTQMVVNYQNGDTICAECGLVQENNFIDYNKEWRTFAADDNHSDVDLYRVGAPTNPLLESCGLATVMVKPKAKSSSLVSKLCRTQNQININRKEDVIKKAFAEIERMTEALGLSFVISSTACEILSKLDKKNLRGGKNLRALCAASVSRACRQVNLPRTLKEITAVANVDMKEINKAVKLLAKSSDMSAPEAVINTGLVVGRFCSKLNISGHREIMAIREAVESAENFDIRRNPKSVLAAAIFMICQISQTNKRPVREIGTAVDVSEKTIKNAVMDMYRNGMHVKIIPKWYACEEDIIQRIGGIIGSWDSATV